MLKRQSWGGEWAGWGWCADTISGNGHFHILTCTITDNENEQTRTVYGFANSALLFHHLLTVFHLNGRGSLYAFVVLHRHCKGNTPIPVGAPAPTGIWLVAKTNMYDGLIAAYINHPFHFKMVKDSLNASPLFSLSALRLSVHLPMCFNNASYTNSYEFY